MTDIEIYAIAVNVLGSITTDLNEGIYSELGGEVKLSWGTTNEINAWAESTSSPINPPKHEITGDAANLLI
ncbi:TPA: hypothetical protein ACRZWP_003801 [Yersinia enterocolitica]